MSIGAINWAWKQSNLKAHTKIILVSLAYRANKNNTCFPSITRIAEDTGQTPRSVKNGIKELEKIGLIKRLFRKNDEGSNRSNLYTIIGFASEQVNTATSPATNAIHTPSESYSPPVVNAIHPPSEQRSPIKNNEKTILNQNNNSHDTNNNNDSGVIVEDELNNIVLLELNDQQTKEAKQSLSQLSKQQRDYAISIFNDGIKRGINRKPPKIYLRSLIDKGKNGLLEQPWYLSTKPRNTNTLSPTNHENSFIHGIAKSDIQRLAKVGESYEQAAIRIQRERERKAVSKPNSEFFAQLRATCGLGVSQMTAII
ncbi:MAG: helix-turn-helix domain-containing protein [Methylococcaceae bacterium]|nr:helix-turn-helix domain-containing protein [Methylococcaceae bacterium]MDD1607212.1 helix-turn-helix domain-containing protein [Methylococcaceae bacterium]MDD1615005.1 helix-turn-helix domain-containing protein [Methylococcaceae bacterium]OYV21445.1 MAG: hypothetical protein CG439_77 [Methylococcaceae bacterium NSP1-2]